MDRKECYRLTHPLSKISGHTTVYYVSTSDADLVDWTISSRSGRGRVRRGFHRGGRATGDRATSTDGSGGPGGGVAASASLGPPSPSPLKLDPPEPRRTRTATSCCMPYNAETQQHHKGLPSQFKKKTIIPAEPTRSSAIAEGPRDASCQLKSCQLPRNSAETTCTTSPV